MCLVPWPVLLAAPPPRAEPSSWVMGGFSNDEPLAPPLSDAALAAEMRDVGEAWRLFGSCWQVLSEDTLTCPNSVRMLRRTETKGTNKLLAFTRSSICVCARLLPRQEKSRHHLGRCSGDTAFAMNNIELSRGPATGHCQVSDLLVGFNKSSN